jgi:hypothetical protein
MPDKIRLREFLSTCVVDQAGRKRNLSSVLLRGLPMVQQLPEHDEPLAIVCSGPSVPAFLDELRSWPGKIWAINGAYRYLLDNGIIPDGFFGMDPLPGLAPYVKETDPHTTFYICSICDPSVFDNLKDRKVQLWHPDGEDMVYPPDQWVIGGGTTAVTRAPYLALLQGYRDITLYGVDSSFSEGEVYCYPHGTYECDTNSIKLLIEVGNEGPFVTELSLMKQVSQLYVLHDKFAGKLKFRCGGLLEAFMRQPVVDSDLFEVEKEPDEADAA